ncbi:hypothetical protein [Sphingopyxis fribergensis]
MSYLRPTILISLIALAALALTSCNDASAAREDSGAAREATGPRGELVMLTDGTTMIARKGTLSRNVADWLAGDEPSSGIFAFGPGSFVAESARLSPDGLGNAADLGTLLRATPNAQLIVDGAASPMAEARAQTLADFLYERGILPNQVKMTTDAKAGQAGAAKGPDSLSLWLERSGAA